MCAMTSTNFKDHFSGHAGSYVRARPGYPAALFSWLAEQCEQRGLAWDCATGNGQAAVALAERFRNVIATDASETQVDNAIALDNVEYRVAPAEQSGIDDNSCDLVTVAQALHWFELEKFYAEARRVLKANGLLAAWGYRLTRVTPEVDRIIDVFDQQIVGPYWPPERRHIDAGYADLPFPFARIDAPDFDMQVQWNCAQFIDYLGTWSSVQRYRNEKGHDPLAWLRGELAAVWPVDEVREVSWPLFMLAGRRR